MKKKLSLIFTIISILSFCQDSLSIEQAIDLALKNSDKSSIIESNFQIKNIQFENYKKSFLPQVSVTANAPYQRSIQEVLSYDGSINLIERNYLSPTVNFITKQILPFTGGEISLTNSVGMNKDFVNKRTAYSSNWANLMYSQNINGFNPYKWDKKKYNYSRKIDSTTYKQQIAQLKTETAKYYTDAYLMQIKYNLDKKNVDKTQILLDQFQEKRKLGRALDVDINQLEVTLLQLIQKLENDKFEYSYAISNLRNQLKLFKKEDSLILRSIKNPSISINKEAFEKAFLDINYTNNAELQLLIADEKIEKTKKEGAISLFLQLGIGVNSSSNNLDNLLNNPMRKQIASLGANIPVLNWGILKNNKKIAELEKSNLIKNLQLTKHDFSIQIEKLCNYLSALELQINTTEEELKIQKKLNNQIYDLLLYNKKTTYDYKNQLFEYEKTLTNYNELLVNKYLLKLKFDVFFQ